VNEWLSGLSYLANERLTGRWQRHIDGVIGFLIDNAYPAEPITSPDGRWGVFKWHPDTHKARFHIIALHPSDTQLHPYFAGKVGSASYYEQERSIYLPSHKVSKVWRGIILHHEYYHAFAHLCKLYRRRKDAHWVEEYYNYASEIQLVRKIYGADYGYDYSRQVLKLSKKYEALLRAKELFIADKQDVPELLRARLFGKAESAYEAGVQRGVIILDALYTALDRMHPNGSKKEHYAITKWFCGPPKSADKNS
jgi:hypothetical protein